MSAGEIERLGDNFDIVTQQAEETSDENHNYH